MCHYVRSIYERIIKKVTPALGLYLTRRLSCEYCEYWKTESGNNSTFKSNFINYTKNRTQHVQFIMMWHNVWHSLLRHCSQQSRDILDTSHKDERSHILGFVGDSPAHKDPIYGSGCVLQPPPPPRSCLAVTRALPGGQVQTTLGDDHPQASACCWTQSVDRRSPTAVVDEGYSSRPPSYVICAGGTSGTPPRLGDVTSGSATPGHTIYAVRRAAVCCAGDYSCCHTQLRHHNHRHLYQPQQQLAFSGRDDDSDDRGPDSDADQLDDEIHPAVCQSSAGDDVTTARNTPEKPAIERVCEQIYGPTYGPRTNVCSNLHAAQSHTARLNEWVTRRRSLSGWAKGNYKGTGSFELIVLSAPT